MATVNLNELFKKPFNPNSTKQYTYQDFNTLSMESLNSNFIGSEKNKSDLNVSIDINAVNNAIVNLLTTKKRQKILDPEFGLRLEDYLFEPVSDSIASEIQKEITNAIVTFEPRVKLIGVRVVPFPDFYKYEIDVSYNIPSLNQAFRLKGNLENGVIEIL